MKFKRRKFLQGMGALVPALMPMSSIRTVDKILRIIPQEADFDVKFNKIPDRVWPGRSLWSVPLEDWKVEKGKLHFFGSEKVSRVNLLEHQLKRGAGDFFFETDFNIKPGQNPEFALGFTIGLLDSTDPDCHKAACYFGEGTFVGVTNGGTLKLGEDAEKDIPNWSSGTYSLKLQGKEEDGRVMLNVSLNQDGKEVTSLHNTLPDGLHGSLSLTCVGANKGGECSWDNLKVYGSKIKHTPENSFGPILWSMYTLSDMNLRITAQLPPVGTEDADLVHLSFMKGEKWKRALKSGVDRTSYTATFQISDWKEEENVPYRLGYRLDGKDYYYDGLIQKDPVDRPLVVGGLTCQHGSGFPYRPLVNNLIKSDPDLLYFSGDQIYEQNGGYPIKRSPVEESILSYLGKWYMFGWAFGEVLRSRPTICTPDDHDVFQGNLWGEGGESISIEEWEKVMDAHGGLVQSVEMVNVVNKTQTSHLPPPVKPDSMKGGMSSWFTALKYGGISFAIITDRLFKSGPQMLNIGSGRIDHIKKLYSPNVLNKEGLSMVGRQQLDFLKEWVEDWNGTQMKVLLSQTIFANACTHHGQGKDFLFGDLDSGGWPKDERDEVLRIIRKASAFHINGDQHIPFLMQYSIDEDRDGPWTFCTPAISTGYPRWCEPDSVNMPFTDRPSHNLPNTGLYRDVFGNKNYIYATGNPMEKLPKEPNRYKMAQAKASGFGLITFDQSMRTIKMEAIRFLADLDILSEENTFPGWPLTINQLDCDGRKPIGYLPRLKLNQANELVKIYEEETGDLVQVMRIRGKEYAPAVYKVASYRIEVGEDSPRVVKGIEITSDQKEHLTV